MRSYKFDAEPATPQGRLFAWMAGQSAEIDVSDQIDEVVREIQAGIDLMAIDLSYGR